MCANDYSETYQVRIRGHLDARWLRWFDNLAVAQLPEGETTITGAMDQAALHGVLNRIRDLGLDLISVQPLPPQSENILESHVS